MPRIAPEVLAPAGDRECLHAAIENGADAVYFGLQHGFNARFRAGNFTMDELPEVMDLLHRRGLKGYLTLNTLAFPQELSMVEETLRGASQRMSMPCSFKIWASHVWHAMRLLIYRYMPVPR